MADVITRFKLETTQYDSKLRDAAKGISDVAHQAELAGQGFNNFSQKSVEAARALGQTSSGATNAKDKVRDLVGAYNDAAKAYNKLTQEQQQSDFGKALAQSLTQLKGRITEAKQELYSIGDSTKSTGGIMDQLASKLAVNIDAFKLLNVGVSAAKAALDVAKSAFMANEAAVDEWGRTMQSAQGLYEGFLNALNTGDISGYLSRMDEIMRAARAAYDELDKLGTMKTIQAPQISAQQTENERMRMMIQTGRYIAPIDGRRASMQNGQLLTPEQIKRIETQLQNGLKTVTSLVGNEVKQTGKAIDAYYNSLAKQNGMSLQEFRKGTSSWDEFSKKLAGFDAYKEWDKNARTEFARQGGRGNVDFDKSNPYADFKKWGVFRVDKQGENSLNDLVKLIQQRDQQTSQAYSTLSQSYRAINRAEGITVSKLMGRGGSGGGGGNTRTTTPKAEEIYPEGSVKDLTKQMQELKKAQDLVTNPEDWKNYETQIGAIVKQINLLTGKVGDLKPGDIQTTGLGNLMSNPFAGDSKTMDIYGTLKLTLDDSTMKNVNEQINSNLSNDGKELQKRWSGAAGAISAVGQAMSSIEDPAAKVMGTIAQAIATIALTYAESLKGTFTPWDWIAGAAAGLAQMTAVISAIHSSTGYAEGGIIKGNTYSGDMIPANGGTIGLNAGEVVLNRAQAGVLASALEGPGQRGGYTPSHVSGEQIWIALNAYTRRTGKGELVTWR